MHSARYSSVAVALHWAVAILIIGQIIGGFYMHNLPNSAPNKFDLYQLHKSVGLTILALTVFRLGWRLSHPTPPLPAHMPDWQKLIARATHWVFYAMLFLIPLTGWLMVSVSPLSIPTVWFGLIPVPHLPFGQDAPDPAALEEFWIEVHEVLAIGTAVLLALHLGAALKHAFVNKDGVLTSMSPANFRTWSAIGGGLGLIAMFSIISFSRDFTPRADAAPTIEASPAGDANWVMDASSSALVFKGVENGNEFEGRFDEFNAQIMFDPDNLDGSRIEVIVATASGATGDQLRDTTMVGDEWFDVGAYPQAIFLAEAFTSLGDGDYQAQGTLTIKDFVQPVTLNFSLDIDGDQARAQGGADVMRTDFGLGMASEWIEDEGVELAVRIDFDIFANRAE